LGIKNSQVAELVDAKTCAVLCNEEKDTLNVKVRGFTE